MSSKFFRRRVLLAGLAALLLSSNATAQFDTMERTGGVVVGGYLNFQDYDFSKSTNRSDSISVHNAGFDPLNATIELQDLSMTSPSVAAFGSGRASQHSEYDGNALSFEGHADISITGIAQIGALIGNGEATTSFSSTFNVAEAMKANLFMSSSMKVNSFYTFELVRQDGAVVWDSVTVDLPGGGASQRTFTQLLGFTPGSYTLTASLKALSGVDPGNQSESTSVDVQFALSPIPEVGTFGLMVWGFLAIQLVRQLALRRR